MKPINGIENVKEAGDFVSLPAGGYICRYTSVSDVTDKQYLYMEFDIAEGEYKDYFKDLQERADFWGGKCYRSYKEKALPMFKRMCSAVSKSNTGFVFDGGQVNSDESTLIGKYVGLVLGEEEYEKNNGDVGTRLYVVKECAVEDIVSGNFKVPGKKTIGRTSDGSFVNVPKGIPEEIPF